MYLEGGEWCYNNQSCSERAATAPIFMSSLDWPWDLSLGGIFDTNPAKSPFAAANKARAPPPLPSAVPSAPCRRAAAPPGCCPRTLCPLSAGVRAVLLLRRVGGRRGRGA